MSSQISVQELDIFKMKPTMSEALEHYKVLHDKANEQEADAPGSVKHVFRELCKNDLFYLLLVAFKRKDIKIAWLYERCLEVQKNPNGFMDLWARYHYKSTIQTYAKTIQDILRNKNLTVAIFSHTKSIAKNFLQQIMRELEDNDLLKENFDDVLWANPKRDAPSWSLDRGVVVRREGNPKEPTIYASGLVDGQPTSMHSKLLVYDDVVTLESVSTPEQIEKTTNAWAMSLNLGGGIQGTDIRYVGTKYHYNDTYKEILEREGAVERRHAATIDGTVDGEPVLMTKKALKEQYKIMQSLVFSSQMLLDPKVDSVTGFEASWIRYYENISWGIMNRYILVDPAGEEKKDKSDYTVMAVIGLNNDNNYYLISMVRDKLNLTERADVLFKLVRAYKPISVGYERYSMQGDVTYLKERMEREHYRFNITELGGKLKKASRIMKLEPVFREGRFFMPRKLEYTNHKKEHTNLIATFLNDEYIPYPYVRTDDMLDCVSRILDDKFYTCFPEARSYDKPQFATKDYDPFDI